MIGTKFAHYEVTSHLGSGGMGEVYQATDSRLGRSVAIKLLPEAFTHDGDRAPRFEREARVLALLNHPNIAAIYGIEESGGRKFLVMELVVGETLQARIKKGPVPVEEALLIAKQIAEALEAAHEKGIIHRDLKPGNVMLTSAGRIKVLDFGLAKSYLTNPSSATSSNSPTIGGTAVTNAGVILGTAAYMSPEQARGKPVDKRADIWAFGAVLFEMLTGQRAFPGEDVTDTLASVVKLDPKWDAIGADVPSRMRQVLRVCLQKDQKRRAQDIGDVRLALDGEFESVSPRSAEPRARLPWMAFAAALLVAAVLAIPAARHFREEPPAAAVPLRFQIPAPQNSAGFPVLSPDGRKAVFQVGYRIWVHSLETGESSDLADSIAGGVPFWSPDSRFVGFASQGKLKTIEAIGGSPQTLTEFPSKFSWGCGAWNQDGVIIFGNLSVGLFRVPASGGTPVQITSLDPARHEDKQYCPSFLPDGRHFFYMRSSTDEGKSAIYLGLLDAKPEQQSSKPIVATNAQAVYTPSSDPGTGYLLFIRGDTLMAQAFDNVLLELKGQAAPVAEKVMQKMISGGTYVSYSASSSMVAFPRDNPPLNQLTWFDRQGKPIGTVGGPDTSSGNFRLSPDGTRLAWTKGVGGAATTSIWLLDILRDSISARFTLGSPVDNNALWAPDGSRIIFSSNRAGPLDLYEKVMNGAQTENLLLKSSENKIATSLSRDGRFLLYTVIHPTTKEDIWVLQLDNNKKAMPFLNTTFSEAGARFSPDGHWVAYASDESGVPEIYIRSISINSSGTAIEVGRQWQVSTGGGLEMRWRGDGQEIYYRAADRSLMAAEIATSPTLRVGTAKPLGSLHATLWDSAADGKRFLAAVTSGGRPTFTVELNWQARLKKQP